MLTLILEAAFRSLLMGLCVGAGMLVLRVHHVLAQKVAWVLVLVAAVVMPLVMRVPAFSTVQALNIPVRSVARSIAGHFAKLQPAHQPTPRSTVQSSAQLEAVIQASAVPAIHAQTIKTPTSRPTPTLPKPKAGKLASDTPGLREQAMQRLAEISPDTAALVSETLPEVAPRSHLLAVNSAALAAKVSFWNWQNVASGLVLLYLAVAAVLLLRIAVGLILAFHIWRRSKPVSQDEIPAAFHTDPALRVRVSRLLTTPVTIARTVILPADYAEWDEAKLSIVLAHEQSHVRQGDFFLQLAAAAHVAVFWFSPLGWWLQRKLSELGEALSDGAGLAQASSAASYAEVLLEFAARPRTNPFASPLAGVAMASSKNLSSRIERILNDRRFRLAFLGNRRRPAVLATILVPAALVAAIALIHIDPAVHAQDIKASQSAPAPKPSTATSVTDSQSSTVSSSDATSAVTGQAAPETTDQVISSDSADQVAPPTPESPAPAAGVADVAPVAPVASVSPAPDMVAPVAPEGNVVIRNSNHIQTITGRNYAFSQSSNGNEDSFAVVHSNGDGTNHINFNGHSQREFEKIRANHHGDFIWVEHNGKSYIVDDPAILAKSDELFKEDPRLKQAQAELQAQQEVLNKRMTEMNGKMSREQLETPEFKANMARLQKQIAELSGERMEKLNLEINQKIKESRKQIEEAARSGSQDELNDRIEKLQELQSERMEKIGDLQGKIGELQGKIGEMQGQIGEKQGEWGEKQGELGEKMGELGEKMGKIGEEQGRRAEEACRKLQDVLDQAIRDGKAKPVN